MANVPITPRIRCDNCGRVEDQQSCGTAPPSYRKPSAWGKLNIEGAGSTNSYGGKQRLDFTDLCPACAEAAFEAAAAVLTKLRSEGFDGPTGAE